MKIICAVYFLCCFIVTGFAQTVFQPNKKLLPAKLLVQLKSIDKEVKRIEGMHLHVRYGEEEGPNYTSSTQLYSPDPNGNNTLKRITSTTQIDGNTTRVNYIYYKSGNCIYSCDTTQNYRTGKTATTEGYYNDGRLIYTTSPFPNKSKLTRVLYSNRPAYNSMIFLETIAITSDSIIYTIKYNNHQPTTFKKVSENTPLHWNSVLNSFQLPDVTFVKQAYGDDFADVYFYFIFNDGEYVLRNPDKDKIGFKPFIGFNNLIQADLKKMRAVKDSVLVPIIRR